MKRFKHFLLGFVAGALVFTSPQVKAFDGLQTIKVLFSNIPIYIDGNRVELSHKAILHEGTTYLPMRDIAEALGKEVLYNNNTKEIYIYEKEGKNSDKSNTKTDNNDLSRNQQISGEFSVNGIALGDSAEDVSDVLGEPNRQDVSEYGFTWYIYNKDYSNYMQVGIKDNKVVALYTNSVSNWNSKKGIRFGSTAASVRKAYGQPLSFIQKGQYRFYFNYKKGEAETYSIDDAFVTFFYDIHNNQTVTSILIIDKNTELSHESLYGEASEELRTAYTYQIFDLTNAVRVRNGLKALTWDEQAAKSSYLHSKDMAENNFFDHDNLKGEDPFDRMKKQGIHFMIAGENIAGGQTNAIYAHEGWMNSKGHRENILFENFERLGVGVYFGGRYKIYYTQNFYTPLKR
ncbi:MAG: copper amine oxidase [Epulopiscium sp.]|jgi:uncharacterized protein YkwD|nr:copper amine oxidase [Candidatus Epulonipiscium sp.]